MKFTNKVWHRGAMVGFLLLTTASAIAFPPTFSFSQASRAVYAQTNHPFEGHNIVYVRDGDRWREAFIRGVAGQFSRGQSVWTYTIDYLDETGGSAQGVTPDRLATIAEAQAQRLTDNVYDLSTPAGIEQMLEAHNEVRRAVGVSELVWSEDLADFAQEWADVLIQENGLRHRPFGERNGGKIGENLTSHRSTAAGGAISHPQRAVQGWVSEKADYDYDSNSCAAGKACGHYTQMVWDDTDAVGCAVARNADQTREVWVCNYTPAGNYVGDRPY